MTIISFQYLIIITKFKKLNSYPMLPLKQMVLQKKNTTILLESNSYFGCPVIFKEIFNLFMVKFISMFDAENENLAQVIRNSHPPDF